MIETCKHCNAEVLSTSQSNRMGTITDEMLNHHLRATGEWCEPHEAERECGVAIECYLTQEDADNINADQRNNLRIGYTAALAAAPAVGGEARETLWGQIAAIYGGLDAEDCAWIDREWMQMRGMATTAPLPSVDQVRQTIADEWGSHVCYTHDEHAKRICDKDKHCRCADIARAVLGAHSLAAQPASPLRGSVEVLREALVSVRSEINLEKAPKLAAKIDAAIASPLRGREAGIKECIELIEKRFLVGWTITQVGLAREDEANDILDAIRELLASPPEQPAVAPWIDAEEGDMS